MRGEIRQQAGDALVHDLLGDLRIVQLARHLRLIEHLPGCLVENLQRQARLF